MAATRTRMPAWTKAERKTLLEMAGDRPLHVLVPVYNAWAGGNGHPKRTLWAIEEVIRNSPIRSVRSVGEWLLLTDAARIVGISTKTMERRWIAPGLIRTRRARGKGFRFVTRTDLRRLARKHPELFRGCSRDALFELLGSEELAEQIPAAFPYRPSRARAVVCRTTGRRWPSIRAAAEELGLSQSGLVKRISLDQPVRGYNLTIR
jgi:hypothetical protein